MCLYAVDFYVDKTPYKGFNLLESYISFKNIFFSIDCHLVKNQKKSFIKIGFYVLKFVLKPLYVKKILLFDSQNKF
jgi:hypothetical protein